MASVAMLARARSDSVVTRPEVRRLGTGDTSGSGGESRSASRCNTGKPPMPVRTAATAAPSPVATTAVAPTSAPGTVAPCSDPRRLPVGVVVLVAGEDATFAGGAASAPPRPRAPPRGIPLPGAPGPQPPRVPLRQQRALPGGGGGAPPVPDLPAHNFHFPLEWAAVPGGPQMADGLRQAATQSAPYMAILNALRPPAAGQPYEAVPTIVRWLLGDCCDAFVNAARPFMAALQPPLPPGRQYLDAGLQDQYLGQIPLVVEFLINSRIIQLRNAVGAGLNENGINFAPDNVRQAQRAAHDAQRLQLLNLADVFANGLRAATHTTITDELLDAVEQMLPAVHPEVQVVVGAPPDVIVVPDPDVIVVPDPDVIVVPAPGVPPAAPAPAVQM